MKIPFFSSKKKRQNIDALTLLGEISATLDPLGVEIFVVRKRCEILFANTHAKARIESVPDADCKSGIAAGFPALCAHCPYGVAREHALGGGVHTIKDAHGTIFEVRVKLITWVDGEPAFIFTLKDMTEEIATQKKLYDLAYIDPLTDLANLTKLKEDFAALETEIINGVSTGVLAIFDLDRFKDINDTYGHNTGDILLRRLVEHLEHEVDFKGHIYRIGGDEFALLYTDPSDRFETEDEIIRYYERLLSAALRSYSLPNIERACSLSIGVSLYPRDGFTLSEILRKADIALHVSKSNGCNQLTFFTGQYDTAQKFKDVYINIRSIMTEDGKTFGYELNDSGEEKNTDESVELREFNRTLDALGMHNLEEKCYYFIAFTKQLLNPTVLINLPRDKFIVHLNPPLRNELAMYRELKKHGYKLAITNLNSRDLETDILELSDYCMFTPKEGNLAKQREIIRSYPYKKFVATGVDTLTEFEAAKNAGFHFYKGYYFRQPEIEKRTKDINPLKLNYVRLMQLSNTEDYMDFREISAIVSSDLALTYKLLRILNTAAVGLKNVTSINNAIAYLGEDNLKKWIAVLALRGAAEDKPMELVRLSLIRAHFGELLAPHFRIRRSPQKLFMIGLLSLLHIALDVSRETLMNRMPVEEDIRDSLLTKTGVYSDMPAFYENYEYANWAIVSQFVQHHQLDASFVNEAYLASVKWVADLVRGVA